MKKCFSLILCLICSALSYNAQDNIETSPFVNVPIAIIKLNPVKPLSKKEIKSLGKYAKYSCPYDPDIELLDLNLKINHFRLPDGNTATFFTPHIENGELSLETTNKIQISRVEIFARITSMDEKLYGTFEEMIMFNKDAANWQDQKLSSRQFYTKGISLPPNAYKVTLVMRDVGNGKLGIKMLNFIFPNLKLSQ